MNFRLPKLVTAADAANAISAISDGIARRELCESEARVLLSLINSFRETNGAVDLESRLAALEQHLSCQRLRPGGWADCALSFGKRRFEDAVEESENVIVARVIRHRIVALIRCRQHFQIQSAVIVDFTHELQHILHVREAHEIDVARGIKGAMRADRYEKLRAAVLRAELTACPGLGILHRRGLAAWIRAFGQEPHAEAACCDHRLASSHNPSPATDNITRLIAGILVAIAMEPVRGRNLCVPRSH